MKKKMVYNLVKEVIFVGRQKSSVRRTFLALVWINTLQAYYKDESYGIFLNLPLVLKGITKSSQQLYEHFNKWPLSCMVKTFSYWIASRYHGPKWVSKIDSPPRDASLKVSFFLEIFLYAYWMEPACTYP